MASFHHHPSFLLSLLLIAWFSFAQCHALFHEEPLLDLPVPSRSERHERERHDHPHGPCRPYSRFADAEPFALDETLVAVKTDAGEIKLLPKGPSSVLAYHDVGLAFISLEPMALLLPQYLNADCLFVVDVGHLALAFVKGGDLHEVDLKRGDIYRIKGGTLFYLYNQQKEEKAGVITIYDIPSHPHKEIESFFVAGGTFPTTVLSGFDADVVATATGVSVQDVRNILTNQDRGPIVFITSSKMKVGREDQRSWQLRNVLGRFLSVFADNDDVEKPYNILDDRSPDFENGHGKTFTVDGHDSDLLRKASIGLFAVDLNPGALLAPHWNPHAAEIGFVTKGEGIIQISYPNGTNALNKKVASGTLFYVPRYYPMTQIASRKGPFQLVGFTTSSKKSNPQFLAGSTSVLRAIDRSILESAYYVSPHILKRFLYSQNDTIILAGPEHATA